MLTYLIEHVNIVRLYVDMWRSVDIHVVGDKNVNIQYYTAEWKPAFLRQAREFLFFPLLPREASK